MSTRKKVLITGGGGQLATDLATAFPSMDTIVLNRGQLDVSRKADVHAAIQHYKPNVIINTAAFTNVDKCESNDEIAQSTNSYGVRNLVQAADRAGAQMVQISTDYVFDGTLGRPYIESDTTNPLSVYGKTKLEGEKAVREGDLLVRTSWLCGTHGSNILKTIIALAQQDKALTFVNDQIGHPSFTSDIALVISNLIDVEAKGTFHVTNQGAVSWFEFAQTVLNSMGRSPAQVSPTTTAELRPPRAAVRPANAALQNDALQWAGLPLAPHFQETLPRLVKDLCG